MGHPCSFVEVRFVSDLLLQNSEDTCRSRMALGSSDDGRDANADTIAVHIHSLSRKTNDDHDRPCGGNFRMPNVITGPERGRELLNNAALGMAGSVCTERRGKNYDECKCEPPFHGCCL